MVRPRMSTAPRIMQWILLRLLLLKLGTLHLDFLHEPFELSSSLDTAYDLVIAVLEGKGSVSLQDAQDGSPDIRK